MPISVLKSTRTCLMNLWAVEMNKELFCTPRIPRGIANMDSQQMNDHNTLYVGHPLSPK